MLNRRAIECNALRRSDIVECIRNIESTYLLLLVLLIGAKRGGWPKVSSGTGVNGGGYRQMSVFTSSSSSSSVLWKRTMTSLTKTRGAA